MISPDLRKVVADYVHSSAGIEQLEDWIIPRLPFYMSNPETADADLVAAIQQGLAEIGDELMTEDEFKESLHAILNKQPFIVDWILNVAVTHSGHVTAGSSNQTVRLPVFCNLNETNGLTDSCTLPVITPR